MPDVSFIVHETWKDPAPADVVLVHGALDRGMAFRKVVQGLHDYNTTVYDRRGYGASVDLGAADDLDVHVADLLELMGDRPAVVIGHSFGGLISLVAASRQPERFAALGVYEPPIPGVGVADFDDGRPSEPADLVPWFYKRMGDTDWDDMPERARAALLAEGPGLAADLRGAFSGKDEFDPATVTMPTIVAHGEQSVKRHVERSVKLAEELPNGSLIVVPGAKHPAHRTHPAEFVEFVNQVIALI